MAHVVGSGHSRQPGTATPRMTSNENDTLQPRGSAVGRLWPVAALLVAIAALFLFGPDNQTVFETLREHRQAMLGFVADNAVLAGATFFAIYVVAIAFSVPGGAMIAIPGSVLFSSGKVTLRRDSKSIMSRIASEIQSNFSGKDIYVFGHTDTDPIKKSKWQDNRQLSSERALAVVRHLQSRGVSPSSLVACG